MAARAAGPMPGAVAERGAVAPVTTPLRWRLACVAILVGGLGAGRGLARRTGPRAATLGAIAATTAVVALVAAGSRKRAGSPHATDPRPIALPPLTVVVAARDEAAVIGGLLGDLAAQDHRDRDGRPRFEVIVIDDRSTDGTPRVAHAAAARHGLSASVAVVERVGSGLVDGKGAALASVPLSACRGEAIVVLDADARIHERYLSIVAGLIAAGEPVLTTRRRMLVPNGSRLAQVQADEQTVDGTIQAARSAIGGCPELRGDGMVIRTDLLARVGGWSASALTEDLELSTRLAVAAGIRVGWTAAAEVWEEPVLAWRDLWRQRVRWAEGSIRRTLEHGPGVVHASHLPLRLKLDLVAGAAQLAGPPVVLGAIVGGLRWHRPWAAGAMLGACLGSAALLTWDALRLDGSGPAPGPASIASPTRPVGADRLLRAGATALFGALWLAAVPAALVRLAVRRGPVRYDKTRHGLIEVALVTGVRDGRAA